VSRPWKKWHFRLAVISLVTVWLFLALFQQIGDVWDETDLLLNNSTAPSTGQLLLYLWTHSIYFYRPLGACVIGLVTRLFDYDVAWRLLRLLNAAMLLGSLYSLLFVIRKWNGADRARDLLLTALFLYSGSALITTGWFPIIFDAGVLLLLSTALLAITHNRPVIGGLLCGLAFLFKENAAIAVPLLVGLWLMGKIDGKGLSKSLVIMIPIGGLYWLQRSNLIPPESPQSVHGFHFDELLPTAQGWFQSFWYQSVADLGLPDFGVIWLIASLAFFKHRKALFSALLLVIAPIFLYWGMFSGDHNEFLVTAAHFQGRFYLVPAAFLLFWLAVWGKRAALIVLLFPVLLGAGRTYFDHQKFQRAYSQIYGLKSSMEPVTVHYPEKPLNDWRRNIRIGDYPDAPCRLNARDGEVVKQGQ